MHIRKLRIKNVRSFREVDLDFSRPDGSLGGWTVLAGRNGSGKTTLLRVLALAAAGPDVARALSPSFAGWIRQDEEMAEAKVYLELQDREPDSSEREFGWAGLTWNSSEQDDEPQMGTGLAGRLSRFQSKGLQEFDVLFFYHEHDWIDVSGIAQKLKSHGISPWVDRWDLRPGVKLVDAYREATARVPVVAIFSGAFGPPRLEKEILDILHRRANLGFPIIPVIVGESYSGRSRHKTDELLEAFNAVNFLRSEPEPLEALVWGITGERRQALIEQVPGFIVAYGPYRRLTGHAVDAQRLMEGPAPIARLVSLFREDASLVECIGWLREIYLRKLEEKPGAAELERAVLSLLNDGLLPDDVKVEHMDSDGLWIRQQDVRLSLQELSDGYRTTAALIMDIARHIYQFFGELNIETAEDHEGSHLRVLQEGVVLIDEVDLHLHVSWQKRVGFWLKRHFPNIQFIVTTHSPFICQAADPGGLIRLPAPAEDRPVEHVSESLYNTVVNGSIDDAVLTELFGLETPYSQETERLRKRVAELEASLQTGGATAGEKDELRDLRSRLPKTLSSDVEQALRKLAVEG